MQHLQQFYIDGEWVEPSGARRLAVIDPGTEESPGEVALGDTRDVDRAVAAARRAFTSFSQTHVRERVALLERILAIYLDRYDEMAAIISREIGAPAQLSRAWQAAPGKRHLEETLRACAQFRWQRLKGTTLVNHEAVGVAALITPWNWPINQIVCKVAPALAAHPEVDMVSFTGSTRAGSVYVNYPAWDPASPFGGYKQSGNGREYGE
jgi:aldehyde dehydrogenase (NAD+)